MKTPDVIEALRRRHDLLDGWVVLVEAFGIDVLALHTWQGKTPTFRRISYEVKVSRADFIREIKRPYKRQYALDVTHQYFFAMPADLAARVLEQGLVPDECGVIAVTDDLRTRRVKTATIREARGWTDREIAHLVRYRMAPSKLYALRRELKFRENTEEHLRERVDDLTMHKEAAYKALDAHLGHLVVEKSLWRGPWPKSWWSGDGEEPDVLVEVTRVYGETMVEIRRTDDVTCARSRLHLERGELLARYRQAAADVVMPLDIVREPTYPLAGPDNEGAVPPRSD